MTGQIQSHETTSADYMLPKDVRFKNQGLDSIEVQDNGTGISPANYESLALKHYTSKLSTYSDLGTLETFGFRGEALSSLCALSRFTVVTCLQSDVPKGTRLDFETSGKLKGTSVIATQKGTIVSVENLFQNLPVRRRELERNIKREWGKVISLLNQYACVQTGVKFTVSQQPNKGKRIVLFSTKGNKFTRENIINVFGAKTMAALVVLDLKLELESTSGPGQRWSAQEDGGTKEVLIKGHVSKPVHGEGRQTPDRQMFYVNGRPCGLPQFAKVFNEVYRSFNSSQSPFIFADIQLDTDLYDVNVSPDKRTILLHDQSRMLDNLRDTLTELFEKQDFTVPMMQITPFKQPAFKTLATTRRETAEEISPDRAVSETAPTSVCGNVEPSEASEDDVDASGIKRMRNLAVAKALARDAQASDLTPRCIERNVDPREEPEPRANQLARPTTERVVSDEIDVSTLTNEAGVSAPVNEASERTEVTEDPALPGETDQSEDNLFFRLAKLKRSFLPESLQGDMSDSEMPGEPPIPAIAKPIKPPENAPLSVSTTRPLKRPSQEIATITIGEHTVTSIIGTPPKRTRRGETAAEHRHSRKESKTSEPAAPLPSFRGRLTQMFAAATATRQLSADDEPLQVEATESDEESRHSEDGHSEASEEIIDEADEEDEASDKSSQLFVEQDEDDHFSASPQEEDDKVLDEQDDNYLDEQNLPSREDLNVRDNSTAVEETSHKPSEENQKRTQAFLKGGGKGKYSTQVLLQRLRIDEESLQRRLESWEAQVRDLPTAGESSAADELENGLEAENAEEKLSLTIHKGDFGKMKIVGQFNLGFILAVRPRSAYIDSSSPSTATPQTHKDDDDLIIVDQHASDEKFNFERLQSTTVVQSQRLVRPKLLELTAVEEEVVIENQVALEKNGFVVSVDTSGDEPVGSRCQLLSLPLSRETTFSLADLEELISLLGDNPTTTAAASDENGQGEGVSEGLRYIPRPSKVRKMFAMRACRSSIMIGKALSRRQMEQVVRHMGEMEKPWNCPHGRPTMRHLCGLGGAWDERGWREGDSCDVVGYLDSPAREFGGRRTDWGGYVKQMREGA